MHHLLRRAQGCRAAPAAAQACVPRPRLNTVHTSAACFRDWRWPAEVGGGEAGLTEKDDVTLRIRSLKREGRLVPARKRKGTGGAAAKGLEANAAREGAGFLKSDAWVFQTGPSFHQRAVKASRSKDYNAARKFFGQSIEQKGNHSKSYLLWARMEEKLGVLPRARALYDQGLAKNPGAPGSRRRHLSSVYF